MAESKQLSAHRVLKENTGVRFFGPGECGAKFRRVVLTPQDCERGCMSAPALNCVQGLRRA
jgi:hypothetical protein